MKVLLLCPHPQKLVPIFAMAGDTVEVRMDRLIEPPAADWIVSYGYQHILKAPVLDAFPRKAVNIHISLLPWNRGSDPNFWSWFDDTPKGVTIHRIDAGIDTGNILAQEEMRWPDTARSLRSTYDDLQSQAVRLFSVLWPMLRQDRVLDHAQTGAGSYHRDADIEPWWSQLSLGYDTPVSVVRALAR